MTTASLVRVPPASARSALPTSCLRLDSVTSTEKVGYSGATSANCWFSARPEIDVHDVAEVDPLIGAKARLVAQRDALGPVLQGLGLALVGNLEGRHLLFLQPLAHVAQSVLGLVEIDGLGAAAGGGGKVLRCGVEGQMALDGVVEALQPEEHLIGLVVVAEPRRLERLDEVDVEIALGLCRRPVVRGTEEQVAIALNAAILPLDLVLPDLVAGDVGRSRRSAPSAA